VEETSVYVIVVVLPPKEPGSSWTEGAKDPEKHTSPLPMTLCHDFMVFTCNYTSTIHNTIATDMRR
jgi:hypothetical protein